MMTVILGVENCTSRLGSKSGLKLGCCTGLTRMRLLGIREGGLWLGPDITQYWIDQDEATRPGGESWG